MTRFFKFTDTDEEMAQNFTAGEWRLFTHLRLLDPYGEKYQEFDTLDILSRCNIKKTTFYKAIAKFEELGLFDFQDKGFNFRSLGLSEKTEDFPKKRKTFRENGIDSEKTENQFGKTEHTIYKESKTLSEAFQNFSPEERERFENFCKKEAELLPTPPRLIKTWAAKNLDDLLSKYKEINPSAFNSNSQGEKCSAAADLSLSKKIDPAIADSLHPLVKQGIADGSIVEISPNWKIGVHQIRLFGGRWVDAKNWVNSQMPRAELPKTMRNQLKAVGVIDE